MDLTTAVITDHAAVQFAKRGISESDVRRILGAPDNTFAVRPGRIGAQAMLGRYLYRVFIDIDRTPPEVVTAYRTSKIEKYRSRP
jgi:hypothetical protein